jgi:fatty-acyl-CoA synthase
MTNRIDRARAGLRSLRSTATEARAFSRMAPQVHRLLPVGTWGPARLLAENVRLRGDQPALLFEGERYTWREIDARACRHARFFASRGVAKGDAVALLFDNRPELIFAQLGLAKLGAVSALLNTGLRGAPLAHAVTTTRPRLLLAGAEHAEAVRDIGNILGEIPVALVADRPPPGTPGTPGARGPATVDAEIAAHDDAPLSPARVWATSPCSYIFTSGTTGLPKAAVISNQRYMGAATLYARVLHQCGPGDVLYVTLPLYHSNAQWMGWGACLASGATMALRRRFSASSFWSDVIRFGATHFLYIGEICRYLLATELPPGARHGLRVAVGNGLREDVWREFTARFGIPTVREFYGATEGNVFLVNLEGHPGRIGRLRPGHRLIACDATTGEPLRGDDGRCREVGEGERGLLIAPIGRLVGFDGYVDKAATEKKILRGVFREGDAYFNSGDLLQLHEDRWVSFADRAGDTFRWKGENVSTREVSQVLDQASGVVESNVYGVEVPGAEGRAGMATLRVQQGFDLDAFADHVVARLAGFQRPYFLRLSDQIALTATFKQRKVDARDEGFDPARCPEPLFFLEGGRYVPLDAGLHARIHAGEVTPR